MISNNQTKKAETLNSNAKKIRPLKALMNFYSPYYPDVLSTVLENNHYSVGSYLRWYWLHQDDAEVILITPAHRSQQFVKLATSLRIGIFLEVLIGLLLIYGGIFKHHAGYTNFGAAVILAYPIVWGHLAAPIGAGIGFMQDVRNPKQFVKNLLCSLLETQVKELHARHSFQVIAVAGSVGKTSTKLAIAAILGQSQTIIFQEGNYNDRLTVPLIFFQQELPTLWNGLAWIRILLHNRRIIRGAYPYQYVIIELGTDAPDQISHFAYTKPDITVITAVTPEHMEFFGTLDAVAKEELAVFDFSTQVLVNIDDVPAHYLQDKHYRSYGSDKLADFQLKSLKSKDLGSSDINMKLNDHVLPKITLQVSGKQGALVALAAAATADCLGLTSDEITRGVAGIKPFAGRMRVLHASNEGTILDDSYNASPVAVTAALDVLYATKTPQRIAILGNMNELGGYSAEAHRSVGEYCNSKLLDWVVTIGVDAEKYLAPAASLAGCNVKSFSSPYEAGKFVKQHLKSSAVILVEGSQNGVFAEEAIKILLRDPTDAVKLVRQSSDWMAIKHRQFGSSAN